MSIRFLKILFNTPPIFRKRIFKLLQLFNQLDQHSRSFQKQSKLKCENGCGRCCQHPDIQASVLEMLPAASVLCSNNLAEDFLEKIKQQHSSVCIFFQKDSLVEGKGRCQLYDFRPTLCRLFGFSIKRNKENKKEVITCSTIKESCHREYNELIQNEKLLKDKAPDVSIYTMKVFSIDPQYGKNLMPINKALKEAIELVGMYKKFS